MTKLTKLQKADRKHLKAEFPNVVLFSFPDHGVTVGIERTGETMGRFAVAIAAADEPKFRRKVGEFHVLERFDREQTLPVNLGQKYGEGDAGMLDTAGSITTAITGN